MTSLEQVMAPFWSAVLQALSPETPKSESDLSAAQSNFLTLHAHNLVERSQWHFMETQLRAHAGKHKVTIWRDELEDLISRGLIERGHGCADMRITDAGRQMVTA